MILDADRGHSPHQLRDGVEGSEGSIGGGDLEEIHLPHPQREDMNDGEADPARRGNRPLA